MYNLVKRILYIDIWGPIGVGLMLGLLYGLGVSISQFIKHDYLHYKLYNLGLLDLQSNFTTYSVVFAIIAAVAYIFFKLINWFFQFKSLNLFVHNSKLRRSLVLFMQLSFLYAIICLFFFSEIVIFFQVLALDRVFKSIFSNPITSFRFLILTFLIGSLFLLFLITYICSKFRLIVLINEKLKNLTSSRHAKFGGVMAVTILVSFSILMFLYSSLNKPDSPNIVLITVDTLRADHLSSYGYEKNTSPNIDSLLEKGVLFENAYSQSSWTFPSMASMHTTLYPSQFSTKKFKNRISDKSLTIAEHLKNNFYGTFAVVSNIVVSEIFGFGQGFDQFENTYSSKADVTTSKATTEKAINYIQKNKDNPFFVWIHYMDPHGHYIDHDEFDMASGYKGTIPSKVGTVYLNKNKAELSADDINYVKDLYDEEILFTDKYIGKLIDSLSELGLEENTIIIFTADHGEELMERVRFGHGYTLYQEVIRVPLIVYNPLEPKLFGNRVSRNVEVRYIAKTILDLTDSNSAFMYGQDLFEFDNRNNTNSLVYSELSSLKKTIYFNEWKLVTDEKLNTYELYNLKEDPQELNNIFNSDALDITELKELLIAKLSNYKNLKKAEADELVLGKQDINKLKALGYLQ